MADIGTSTPFSLREAFHLLFLRFLAEAVAGPVYALKGGVCLRFFYRSPRLSEDLDFDVVRIPVATFRTKIRNILNHRALRERLRIQGILNLTITEPKQTETTQRWKVQLVMGGGPPLSTRIECSRRQKKLTGIETGVPTAEILNHHQVAPFVCRHYGLESMIRQKLEALASPGRAACRDLFDLHHLLRLLPPDSPRPPETTDPALEKIEAFRFGDFQAQVLPFLPADLSNHYRNEKNFENLRGETLLLLTKK